MQIAASGVQAGQTLFDVAAHNLANVSTNGFQPERAALSEVPGAAGQPGRGVEVTRIGVPDGATPTLFDHSGVDVAGELVGTITAAAMYRVNAKVISIEAETTRSVLDVHA